MSRRTYRLAIISATPWASAHPEPLRVLDVEEPAELAPLAVTTAFVTAEPNLAVGDPLEATLEIGRQTAALIEAQRDGRSILHQAETRALRETVPLADPSSALP